MSTPELVQKIESLSLEDYNMVMMLVERLTAKPSDILKKAREKYVRTNPMSMEEIDEEIQQYRREKQS
ncbi:MAG: hypothetical protein NC433_14200 [Clostridiales bacterium]|nr:hypothetical protein [Clostridiales bacterium]